MNHDRKSKILTRRIEIYKDFILTLVEMVFKYYIDKESINTKEIMKNHFYFCYNKTCDIFLEENLDLRNNKELIDYFFNYFHINLYDTITTQDKNFFIRFWDSIFDIDKVSKRRDNDKIVQMISVLINVFEKSINKKENIFNYL